MIIAVGEALLDLVADSHGQRFAAHPGGSPANVAVGLARLGVPVTLATQLGDDLPGRLIRRWLRASGVTVEALASGTARTSMALASLDPNGAADYDFQLTWDITEIPNLASDCRCVHIGSIATALSPGAQLIDALLDAAHRRGAVTVSYDPNIRPALLGSRETERTRVERQVRRCDVVKVSTDDLQWLYPERDHTTVAGEWLASGPALVVVTRGAAGSYAVNHTTAISLPAIPVTVVDTVGAGDAFTAGLLSGLADADLLGGHRRAHLAALDAASLTEIVGFASQVAGVTCRRPGADPPARADLP